jgi:hypothetical protein
MASQRFNDARMMAALSSFTLVGCMALILMGCESRKPVKAPQPVTAIQPEQGIASTTILPDTSFSSGKEIFQLVSLTIDSDLLLLTVKTRDRLLLQDTLPIEGITNTSFPDCNNDGYADIRIHYQERQPSSIVYLYGPESATFRILPGFSNYPAATPLASCPKYFYSYDSIGCNGMNWESVLFTIEGYNTLPLARMVGKGCDDNLLENPRLIGIYAETHNNNQSELLVTKLDYLQSIPTPGDKAAFIATYWKRNLPRFQRKKS